MDCKVVVQYPMVVQYSGLGIDTLGCKLRMRINFPAYPP
jgi:hypothetical protein